MQRLTGRIITELNDDISLSSSEKVKTFQTTAVEKIKKHILCCTYFLLGNYPASEFRRRVISQKKARNIQKTAKAWNQEHILCLSKHFLKPCHLWANVEVESDEQLVHVLSSADVARRLMLIAKRDKRQFVVKTWR